MQRVHIVRRGGRRMPREHLSHVDKLIQWHDRLERACLRSERTNGTVADAYLWEPKKLQVEFAHLLAERRRRATIIRRREWRNILEKESLLIVIPLDGPAGR